MALALAADSLAIALALAADILALLAIDIALDVLSWMLSMESVIDFFLFTRELASSNFFWELRPGKDGHRSMEAAPHELVLLLR